LDNENTIVKKPRSMGFTALLILIFGLWSPVKSVMTTVLAKEDTLSMLAEKSHNDTLQYVNIGLGFVFIFVALGIFFGKNYAKIAFYLISPIIIFFDYYLFGFQYSFLIKPVLFVIFVIILNSKEFQVFFNKNR